jgi:hypothetical protein
MKTMAAAALVAATCLVAITIAMLIVAAAANARNFGTTCSYKQSGMPIYITVYGSDNMPSFCSLFARSAGRQFNRWYGYVPGRTRCVYGMNALNVYVRVKSTSALGDVFCVLLNPGKGWTQLS